MNTTKRTHTADGIAIFWSNELKQFVTIPDREQCTCHELESCPDADAE